MQDLIMDMLKDRQSFFKLFMHIFDFSSKTSSSISLQNDIFYLPLDIFYELIIYELILCFSLILYMEIQLFRSKT